jgi:hypothetical protein
MVYTFKRGSRLTGDAQAVGETLDALKERDGELRPEAVEREARKRRSPLHDLFEWDDTAAALQHRLGQAAHIIRCIIVVDDPLVPEAHTAYVRVEVDDNGGVDEEPVRRSSYQRTVDVMTDDELRKQVLDRARKEHTAWEKRYENLLEVAEICAASTKKARRKKVAA